MDNTSNKGLRELAHKYYKGELSYESYRSERTRLLDKLTGATGTDESTRRIVQSLYRPHEAAESPGNKYVFPRYLSGKLWLLLVILTAILVVAWAMVSGWFPLSLTQLEPTYASVTPACPELTRIKASEQYKHSNG
jgi:hypothetical protein